MGDDFLIMNNKKTPNGVWFFNGAVVEDIYNFSLLNDLIYKISISDNILTQNCLFVSRNLQKINFCVIIIDNSKGDYILWGELLIILRKKLS